MYKTHRRNTGFTIVELLIVVVVIAILAAIVIVAYNGISSQAKESALKSDLQTAAKQLQLTKVDTGAFPGDVDDIKKADTTTLTYTHTDDTFCLAADSSDLPNKTFHITEGGTIEEGGCSEGTIVDGSLMQTITSANCPTTRTRAVDARDNHTYWVQKLADDKCWMLTNLAYAGGGTNTYSDVKTLTNGTSGSATYTVASYYIVPSTTNFTTEPTAPSTATTGTGQYGYLYNWCAAMGNQQSTSACLNAITPAASTSISICPASWRLPVGNGGEFTALNNAINSGSTSSDAGLLNPWLAQRSGVWYNAFSGQGSYSDYWSSTQYSAAYAYLLAFDGSVNPSSSSGKDIGYAVRCVAS